MLHSVALFLYVLGQNPEFTTLRPGMKLRQVTLVTSRDLTLNRVVSALAEEGTTWTEEWQRLLPEKRYRIFAVERSGEVIAIDLEAAVLRRLRSTIELWKFLTERDSYGLKIGASLPKSVQEALVHGPLLSRAGGIKHPEGIQETAFSFNLLFTVTLLGPDSKPVRVSNSLIPVSSEDMEALRARPLVLEPDRLQTAQVGDAGSLAIQSLAQAPGSWGRQSALFAFERVEAALRDEALSAKQKCLDSWSRRQSDSVTTVSGKLRYRDLPVRIRQSIRSKLLQSNPDMSLEAMKNLDAWLAGDRDVTISARVTVTRFEQLGPTPGRGSLVSTAVG